MSSPPATSRRRLDQARNTLDRIAEGAGGVLAWGAIGRDERIVLRRAGLLTVDAVREALRSGRLLDFDGVGPARYRRIARALMG